MVNTSTVAVSTISELSLHQSSLPLWCNKQAFAAELALVFQVNRPGTSGLAPCAVRGGSVDEWLGRRI